MKCLLDSMNKSEVRFKSEHVEVVHTKIYDGVIDTDKPVVTITVRRIYWESIGRPNVMHADIGERCSI
jgi:hypothetical protein